MRGLVLSVLVVLVLGLAVTANTLQPDGVKRTGPKPLRGSLGVPHVNSKLREQESTNIAEQPTETTIPATTTTEQAAPAATTTTTEQAAPAATTTTTEQAAPAATATTTEQAAPAATTTTTEQATPAATTTTTEQAAPAATATTTEQATPAATATTTEQVAPVATTTTEQTAPAATTTTAEQTAPAATTTTTEQATPATTTTEQVSPAATTATAEQVAPAATTTTTEQATPAATTTEQVAPVATTTTTEQTAPAAATTTTTEQATPATAATTTSTEQPKNLPNMLVSSELTPRKLIGSPIGVNQVHYLSIGSVVTIKGLAEIAEDQPAVVVESPQQDHTTVAFGSPIEVAAVPNAHVAMMVQDPCPEMTLAFALQQERDVYPSAKRPKGDRSPGPGAEVVLQNMKTATFNGQKAIVQSWTDNRVGHFLVLAGRNVLAVKPENVVRETQVALGDDVLTFGFDGLVDGTPVTVKRVLDDGNAEVQTATSDSPVLAPLSTLFSKQTSPISPAVITNFDLLSAKVSSSPGAAAFVLAQSTEPAWVPGEVVLQAPAKITRASKSAKQSAAPAVPKQQAALAQQAAPTEQQANPSTEQATAATTPTTTEQATAATPATTEQATAATPATTEQATAATPTTEQATAATTTTTTTTTTTEQATAATPAAIEQATTATPTTTEQATTATTTTEQATAATEQATGTTPTTTEQPAAAPTTEQPAAAPTTEQATTATPATTEQPAAATTSTEQATPATTEQPAAATPATTEQPAAAPTTEQPAAATPTTEQIAPAAAAQPISDNSQSITDDSKKTPESTLLGISAATNEVPVTSAFKIGDKVIAQHVGNVPYNGRRGEIVGQTQGYFVVQFHDKRAALLPQNLIPATPIPPPAKVAATNEPQNDKSKALTPNPASLTTEKFSNVKVEDKTVDISDMSEANLKSAIAAVREAKAQGKRVSAELLVKHGATTKNEAPAASTPAKPADAKPADADAKAAAKPAAQPQGDSFVPVGFSENPFGLTAGWTDEFMKTINESADLISAKFAQFQSHETTQPAEEPAKVAAVGARVRLLNKSEGTVERIVNKQMVVVLDSGDRVVAKPSDIDHSN